MRLGQIEDIEHAAQQLKKARTSLAAARAKVMDLEKQNATLLQQKNSMLKQQNTTKTELDSLKAEIELRMKESDAAREKMAAEVAALKNLEISSQSRSSNINLENAKLKEEISRKEKILQDFDYREKTLKTDIEQLQQKLTELKEIKESEKAQGIFSQSITKILEDLGNRFEDDWVVEGRNFQVWLKGLKACMHKNVSTDAIDGFKKLSSNLGKPGNFFKGEIRKLEISPRIEEDLSLITGPSTEIHFPESLAVRLSTHAKKSHDIAHITIPTEKHGNSYSPTKHYPASSVIPAGLSSERIHELQDSPSRKKRGEKFPENFQAERKNAFLAQQVKDLQRQIEAKNMKEISMEQPSGFSADEGPRVYRPSPVFTRTVIFDDEKIPEISRTPPVSRNFAMKGNEMRISTEFSNEDFSPKSFATEISPGQSRGVSRSLVLDGDTVYVKTTF